MHMIIEVAYFSRPSLRIWSSRCVQSAASGPPYLRFCPGSAGILDEPVETTTEGVVLNMPTLASIPVEQSRYVGMLPDPLVVALVWNETTCWLQSDWENAPKFTVGSSAICRHNKFSRTALGSSSLQDSSPRLQTNSEMLVSDERFQVHSTSYSCTAFSDNLTSFFEQTTWQVWCLMLQEPAHDIEYVKRKFTSKQIIIKRELEISLLRLPEEKEAQKQNFFHSANTQFNTEMLCQFCN